MLLMCCCVLSSYAQDCALKLNTARDYKAKKDFKNAIKYYRKVLDDCGDYDGKVSLELRECEKRIIDMNAVFQLTGSKLECEGEGGTLVLKLKKTPTDWSVKQFPEWLKLSEIIKDEKKVVFNVEANPKAEIRKGTIQLKSDKGRTQDFTVIQKNGVERVSAQTDFLSFGNGGGQQTIIVDANFNWGFGTSDSWLQLSKQNNDKLLVTCVYNGYPKERKAKITIFGEYANQNIEVTQFAGDTYFSVSGVADSIVLFDASGGKNNELRVSCNDEWIVKNRCTWVDVYRSNDAIVVKCQPNPWAERRTSSFEVVATTEERTKTILVEQGGAKPTLDKISLPSKNGERTVTGSRPHYRSLYLKGNGGDLKVKVHSNVQTWTFHIVPEEENWMTGVAFPQDSLIELHLSDNNGWIIREADVVISAMGIYDTLNVRQNIRGYNGLLDDYFDGSERVWKTTKFFIDLYGAESLGFRIGGLAKRWKFVEFSLLDFDVEYLYHWERAYRDVIQAFHLDWEPIVRGYLPFSRDGRRWAAYVGMGISVNLFSLELYPNFSYFYRMPKFLFEMGAEFNWIKKDNVSSRIFYRYDGYSSVGISFDFYKWTKKWKE